MIQQGDQTGKRLFRQGHGIVAGSADFAGRIAARQFPAS